MKKTKRILSLLTALTITASAFASLVIPASAAETQIGLTYTFDAEGDAVWAKSGTHAGNFTEEIVEDATLNSKVLKLSGEHGGGRTAAVDFPAAITPSNTDPVKLEFDWYSRTGGNKGNKLSSMDVIPSGTGSKQIFKLTESSADTDIIAFNGTAIADLTRGWYKVSAVLDFETHRIIEFTLTKNGESTPALTKKDIPFIDNTASDISQFGLVFNRGAKDTADVDIRFDNVAAYTVTDTYYKVEMNIKDNQNQPVEDAAVKLGNTDYVTGADGKVVTKLANGSYDYTVSKIGFVDGEGNETATGTIQVSGAVVNEDVTYSLKPYTPVVTSVSVGGGQTVVSASATDTPATTTAFTVAVKDQNETAMEEGYTTAWAVYPTGTTTANTNVTIADGVVSVAKDYKAASGDASVFDVVATVTDANDDTKTATNKTTITVANSDVLFYGGETSFTASGAKGDVSYDIDDITIPEDGIRIAFDFYKGAYDSTKDDRYGQISFKSDDDTLFYMKDMNAGLTLNTDDEHSVSLGSTARDTAYPTEITIIGSQLIVKFNNGEYKVVEMSETPTKITSIVASSNQDNGSGTGAKNLVMSSKVTVDKTKVNIIGDDQFAKIAGKTVTRQYEAKPYIPEASDNFTWTVTDAAGVSIDAESGLLSVTDAATAGTVTVTATSGTKTGSIEVEIKDVVAYTAAVEYPNAVQKGESAKLTVTKITDALNDDVTEYFTPTWSIDNAPDADASLDYTGLTAGKATAIYASYDGAALTSVTSEEVTVAADGTLSVTAPSGAKVYIWDSLDGMKPVSTDIKTAPTTSLEDTQLAAIGSHSGNLITNSTAASGTVTVKLNITGSDTAPTEYTISIADFTKIVDAEAGAVSVSDLVTYGATTFSVVRDDGVVITKTASNDEITLTAADVDGATELEIIPNYKFDLGGASEDGYVKVEGTKENGYGFTSTATPATGVGTGIQSKGVDLNSNSFEVDIPDGRYDMTFYKADKIRTHIRVNDYMTVTEADFTDGDNGTVDPMAGPGVYTKLDVNVTGGVAKINAYEWGQGNPLMAAVEITKKSEDFQSRKTHVWIAGDSTVCIYRPTPAKDDSAPGTRRTGWGQLLQNYLSDDVIVDDFAHSGDWAANWYANTFPSVLQHAEAGDYLIIQFGINDRTRTPDQKVMSAALEGMIDRCRAKGVIPVLQTPELCVSQYGTQVTEEHTKPNGSGHAGYFEVNRTVAKEKNTLLIDLADISATMWATMGKTWVTKNYFLSETVTDNQHMSYIGAKLVASMVATEILDQQAAGKKGAAGESFDGIPVNAKVQADVTYTDASDNTQKTITRQAAEFKPSEDD